MPTVEGAIAGYRKLRDQKSEIQERHKEELAPFNERLEKIENWLALKLQEAEADSIKTSAGTVYTTTTASVKIHDWGTALRYIVEQDLFHLLEKRLATKEVETYVEEEQQNFPGTEIAYRKNTRVRK